MRPFWQAATIISTPHSSISNLSQASEAIQSTASSAEQLISSNFFLTFKISFFTDVEVSTCVIKIALYLVLGSDFSFLAKTSISKALFFPKSTTSTLIPSFLAISAHPWAKRPVATTKI